MNSNLPIRQLPRVQALINAYENLQPNLQAMVATNPLLARLNSQQGANVDTLVNGLDSMRSLGKIYPWKAKRIGISSISPFWSTTF